MITPDTHRQMTRERMRDRIAAAERYRIAAAARPPRQRRGATAIAAIQAMRTRRRAARSTAGA